AMRATSYSLDAAKLMGINTDWIIALTFAVGSALAAAGGILVTLLYPKIEPLMGVMPGLKAFAAAVLGGIGNMTGAMLGGLILGINIILAVSLNLINGTTGQFSIGHAGFYAVGAYTSASLLYYGQSTFRGWIGFLPTSAQDVVLLLFGLLAAALAAGFAGLLV